MRGYIDNAYDAASRLTGVTHTARREEFRYDALGNPLAGRADTANRLLRMKSSSIVTMRTAIFASREAKRTGEITSIGGTAGTGSSGSSPQAYSQSTGTICSAGRVEKRVNGIVKRYVTRTGTLWPGMMRATELKHGICTFQARTNLSVWSKTGKPISFTATDWLGRRVDRPARGRCPEIRIFRLWNDRLRVGP